MSRKEIARFLNIQSFCSVLFVFVLTFYCVKSLPRFRAKPSDIIGGPFRPFSFQIFFADRAIYIKVRKRLLRAGHIHSRLTASHRQRLEAFHYALAHLRPMTFVA